MHTFIFHLWSPFTVQLASGLAYTALKLLCGVFHMQIGEVLVQWHGCVRSGCIYAILIKAFWVYVFVLHERLQSFTLVQLRHFVQKRAR